MNPSAPLIREARPEDAPAIAQIHVATWRVAYRGQLPDAYLDSLDPKQREPMWRRTIGMPDHPVFVAVDAGRIVGFCSLTRSRNPGAGEAAGEIPTLYVEPGRWRRGCGARLLDAALQRAAAMNLREVTLWVLDSNRQARAFYEKHGFVRDGATKEEQRWGVTAREVRYRRSLSRNDV